MANDEHVALLKQGVAAWNAWRGENPNIRPDLHGANLRGADLTEAWGKRRELSRSEAIRAMITEILEREPRGSGRGKDR
jgi:hypothetical protein